MILNKLYLYFLKHSNPYKYAKIDSISREEEAECQQ